MDKTVPPGRVKGTLTPPCSKSYAQRALAAALLSEEVSVLRNIEFCDDTRSALQCIADARRAGAPGRSHIALDRRRTVPEGLRAQRRRIGPLDTSFHARGIALPHTRHHRGARLAAAPPDADDVRTAPPAGRAGPRQRGIPPHRGLRPDPGRRGRSRRVGLVAVHHGAAARAAAGQARHLAARTRSGLDTYI